MLGKIAVRGFLLQHISYIFSSPDDNEAGTGVDD